MEAAAPGLTPPALACHALWTMKTAMSDSEISKERRYIIAERLCIMLPDGSLSSFTDAQLIATCAEAIANADAWEDRYMDSI